MEISVKNVSDPTESHNFTSFYVHLNAHRILAVATHSTAVLAKWLNDVLKSPSNTRRGGTTVVGVAVAEEGSDHLLTLCVGSHSLHYLFPDFYEASFKKSARSLSEFFRSSAVVTVADDAKRAAEFLRRQGVEVENLVGVRSGVVAPGLLLRKEVFFVDLLKLDLGDLAAAVVVGSEIEATEMPRRMEIVDYRFGELLTREALKFSNLESYLLFLIAFEFAGTLGHGMSQSQASSGFEWWSDCFEVEVKRKVKKNKKMRKDHGKKHRKGKK